MEAKEKALQLVDKFMVRIILQPNKITFDTIPIAKQCALICVEEIIDYHENYSDDEAALKYFREVKQEINQLT